MATGLSRRIKYAFILQAVMATFAILVGAYAATVVVLEQVSRRTLEEEAAAYRQRLAANPAARPPSASVLQGYLSQGPAPSESVPNAYRYLEPGFHELPAERKVVLVQDGAGGRLYLAYQQWRLQRMAFWFVLSPIALALLAVFVSIWATYRMAKRMVAPIDWLAQEVARWNPREPDTTALGADRLPQGAGPETQQLAAALQRMGERTRAFVRRERDFTRDASHELRTPLTVIRVASDLMQGDPELPERMQRSVSRIQGAGRDMEEVIDAFLILAREGDIEPQREDFDVRDVVLAQVELARPLLAGKPVELEVLESGSPRLHASPRVMAVMLGNLLRNACTFTERGRITVRIDADRVAVQDTGIGMSEETLQRAYDPFFRGDPDNPSGKGMGLSIVRRLGDRFGWPVSIESQPGHGTSAVIRFAA